MQSAHRISRAGVNIAEDFGTSAPQKPQSSGSKVHVESCGLFLQARGFLSVAR